MTLMTTFCTLISLDLHTRQFNYLAGNHAVAIVKEKENYDALKESLANVIRDVNALIEVGHMIVDGQRVNLDFYLGGDYKVNKGCLC